ncbi:hypothetical protein BJ508DRAFT_106765 [Ascobolus immersus RN42]|uniref:Actin-like ATPase domain-containing protein n=1 Tax=Ascobolus immersus RN42 TaxID=1160509 RepID=A0A3N4I6W4_ASCIM|nr:hypothetical protein BJ508DRAFT_106765 [Ascobolus immersus RN42]
MFRASLENTWRYFNYKVVLDSRDQLSSKRINVVSHQDDDAVWCLKDDHISNCDALCAFLLFVYYYVNPPFNTPIFLVIECSLGRMEKELLSKFFFERLKVPGVSIVDSSLAIAMAYGQANCLVLETSSEGTRLTSVLNYSQTTGKTKFYGTNASNKAEVLSSIADGIYEEIRAIDEPAVRQALASTIIIVNGQGNDVRTETTDFSAGLLDTLNVRHHGSSLNRRLQSLQGGSGWKGAIEINSEEDADVESFSGRFRIANFPEYLTENLEKANNCVSLLGTQIFGRLVYTNDTASTGYFQTRLEYNANGPAYIQL